jgi:hypothetical protein
MRLVRATCVVAAVAVLAGCGASTSDQVRQKIEQYVHAEATGDAKTLCEQVLAPTLLARLAGAGLKCETAMKIHLTSVHDPFLSIGRVTITGKNAQVIALTGAHCQQAGIYQINLVSTSDGWRIASTSADANAKGVPSKPC